mmetsp:Transcript_2551/g.7547  ORF Transcript_2551/g.7547 Transcript_2551/m.7547 type:complete len:408 (-) Transcript_2551:3353-4576(-)
MSTVTLLSGSPRLAPCTRTRSPPYTGPSGGVTDSTCGGSYVNAASSLWLDLSSTDTTTLLSPAVLDAVRHTTDRLLFTSCTSHGTPPTLTVGRRSPSAAPKLTPDTVSSVPPYVGPAFGCTLDTRTGLYVTNRLSPLLYENVVRPPVAWWSRTCTTTFSWLSMLCDDAGTMHRRWLASTNSVRRQATPPTNTSGFSRSFPKLLPCTSTTTCPYVGTTAGTTRDTVGGRYANHMAPSSLCRLSTYTTTSLCSPAPGGTVHRSSVSDTCSMSRHARSPTLTTTCWSSVPKLRPCTTISVPPNEGPTMGDTCDTTGSSYTNRVSAPRATDLCGPTRTDTPFRLRGSPAGVTQRSCVSDTQSVSAHAWPPISTSTPSPDRPKPLPYTVIRVPPYAGPFAGDTCPTTGPTYS